MTKTPSPLRDYQADAIEEIVGHVRGGRKKVLLVMPTGSGKTKVGVEMARMSIAKGKRALWIAHRDELISQAAARAAADGIDGVGIIAAKFGRTNPSAPMQVASVSTLLARNEFPPADLLLLDECHHYVSEHWSKLLKEYAGKTHIGLSATPERSDGRPMGDIFEELVHGPQPADLIAAGHLVPCEVVAPPKPMKGGIAWDPLEAWKRFSGGRRTVAFCATTQASKDLRDRFVSEGIRAAHIDMHTPKSLRDSILADLASGSIQVVTNVYVLTEGTDIPAVEVCLMARTCGSAAMTIQAVGRTLRPSPATGKKKALWIDLPGGVHRFGTMDCERIYSLHGDHGLTTAKKSLDNLKCRKCDMIMPKDENGACVGCGYTAPPKQDEGAGPEIKNVDISFVRQMQANPGLVEAYARLVVSGRQKGYKDALAAKRFFEMYGQWPEANWLPWLEARIFPLFQTDRALPSNFTRVLASAIGEIAALEFERGHHGTRAEEIVEAGRFGRRVR